MLNFIKDLQKTVTVGCFCAQNSGRGVWERNPLDCSIRARAIAPCIEGSVMTWNLCNGCCCSSLTVRSIRICSSSGSGLKSPLPEAFRLVSVSISEVQYCVVGGSPTSMPQGAYEDAISDIAIQDCAADLITDLKLGTKHEREKGLSRSRSLSSWNCAPSGAQIGSGGRISSEGLKGAFSPCFVQAVLLLDHEVIKAVHSLGRCFHSSEEPVHCMLVEQSVLVCVGIHHCRIGVTWRRRLVGPFPAHVSAVDIVHHCLCHIVSHVFVVSAQHVLSFELAIFSP